MTAGRETDVARPAGPTSGQPRRGVRALGSAAVLLGLVFAWLYLAPAQVGGATSYAVIVGSSMEPTLTRGDLVLVRPQARYEAGDVVLYHDPQLRAKVMHRIARVDGERYVLKGDNNEYLDTSQPTADQIVGELWVTAPGVGKITTWLREPLHAAFLVGLATFIALGGGLAVGTAVSGRRGRKSAKPEPPRAPPSARHLPAVLPFACVAFGILTVIAFTRPTSRLVDRRAALRTRGSARVRGHCAAEPGLPRRKRLDRGARVPASGGSPAGRGRVPARDRRGLERARHDRDHGAPVRRPRLVA